MLQSRPKCLGHPFLTLYTTIPCALPIHIQNICPPLNVDCNSEHNQQLEPTLKGAGGPTRYGRDCSCSRMECLFLFNLLQRSCPFWGKHKSCTIRVEVWFVYWKERNLIYRFAFTSEKVWVNPFSWPLLFTSLTYAYPITTQHNNALPIN